MPDAGDTPSDSLHERAEQSRVKSWLLLEGDRWLVAGSILACVFVTLAGVGVLYPPADGVVRASDSVDTLFQGLLTATITGVTLVLTLNQLVLSQELGAVGDQRERMEGAMQFRSDVADAVGAPVSPARPAQFLRALVQVTGERADDLRDAVDEEDERLQSAVTEFTDSLIRNAESVSAGLDDARFGEFDVISSALDFNYSWKIFTARRLRSEHGEALGDVGVDALDRLVETLRLFGPAREHFKTLYFQWELIDLSQRILASAVPALLVSAAMVVFFDASAYGVSVFGVDTLVVLVAAAATLAVSPFVILLAYVMRISTVTKHTLSIGPFILRETDDVREVEWEG